MDNEHAVTLQTRKFLVETCGLLIIHHMFQIRIPK